MSDDAGMSMADAGDDGGMGPTDSGMPDAGPIDAGQVDAGPLACATDCSELDGECAEGVCDGTTGTCMAVTASDGSGCDDGDSCTSGDVCTGGACAGTDVDCSAMSDACHVGYCDDATGTCMRMNAADGTSCDDGMMCTTGDVCTAGACAGTDLDCSAMTNACNIGTCNTLTGACTQITRSDGTSCSDGMVCTTGDMCMGGVCSGAPVVCPTTECRVGSCGPAGACMFANQPNGTSCTADTNLCTRDECTGGVCGGTLVCRPPADFMPFGSFASTMLRGMPSAPSSDDTCPLGMALVGFEGTTNSSVPAYFGTLRGVCRSLSISGSGAGPYTFADEGPSFLLPNRGTSGTGALMSTICPAGQIVVGFSGRDGGAIDRIAVRCAPLSIVATPTEWVVSVGTTITTATAIGGTGGVMFPNTDCPAGQVATRVRMHHMTDVNGLGLACQTPRLSYAVALTGAGMTAQHGGTGGTAFNDPCPAGTAVVRYQGGVSAGGLVSSIQATCAPVEVVGPVASPSVVLRLSTTTTPMRGGPGPGMYNIACNASEAMVGFSGREGTLLDQVTFRCAPLTANATGLLVGTPVDRGTAGTSPGGAPFAATDCPGESFTTRTIGRSAALLDALAMGCSTATW